MLCAVSCHHLIFVHYHVSVVMANMQVRRPGVDAIVQVDAQQLLSPAPGSARRFIDASVQVQVEPPSVKDQHVQATTSTADEAVQTSPTPTQEKELQTSALMVHDKGTQTSELSTASTVPHSTHTMSTPKPNTDIADYMKQSTHPSPSIPCTASHDRNNVTAPKTAVHNSDLPTTAETMGDIENNPNIGLEPPTVIPNSTPPTPSTSSHEEHITPGYIAKIFWTPPPATKVEDNINPLMRLPQDSTAPPPHVLDLTVPKKEVLEDQNLAVAQHAYTNDRPLVETNQDGQNVVPVEKVVEGEVIGHVSERDHDLIEGGVYVLQGQPYVQSDATHQELDAANALSTLSLGVLVKGDEPELSKQTIEDDHSEVPAISGEVEVGEVETPTEVPQPPPEPPIEVELRITRSATRKGP